MESVLSPGTPHDMAVRSREAGISGRVFAPMDWADYLIYYTDEAVRPLIFSHVHLTHPDVMRDYLRIYTATETWLQIVGQTRNRLPGAGSKAQRQIGPPGDGQPALSDPLRGPAGPAAGNPRRPANCRWGVGNHAGKRSDPLALRGQGRKNCLENDMPGGCRRRKIPGFVFA